MKNKNQRTNPPLSLRSRTSFEKGGLFNCLGFTLFELLVSISIIGILTALAVVAYSGAQKKARDTRRMQDMKAIQVAAEQFYSQNNYNYPPDELTPWIGTNSQNILEVFPQDPKSGAMYTYDITVNDGYCACAVMENLNNGNSDTSDCSSFANSGVNFCVKNQQ